MVLVAIMCQNFDAATTPAPRWVALGTGVWWVGVLPVELLGNYEIVDLSGIG